MSLLSTSFPLLTQTKVTLEKSKSALEVSVAEMSNDHKALNQSKQESERKRKNLEAQLSEITVRLSESERARTEFQEKATKQQVWKFKTPPPLQNEMRALLTHSPPSPIPHPIIGIKWKFKNDDR